MTDEAPRQGPPRTPEEWDARYKGEPPPWETGRVDRHLRATVEGGIVEPCRVLEVGCGSGSDSVWLASRGFEVTGVDISPTAIEMARSRAKEANVGPTLAVGSFPSGADPFDLVYDCGCFHTLDGSWDRTAFVANIARRLSTEGQWLSILGSTDGPSRDHGPPRRSALDIAAAVEPHLEILSLLTEIYDADTPTPARAWIMLARKRG